jgi:Rrf2 family iron-sulfur cluster assembly transcriptional regulator
MRFQKTTEYAIRVMVHLAANLDHRISTRNLSEELIIPYKYLGRLMSKLAAAGLADVELGVAGGYKIVKTLDSINLFQIAEVVEGIEDYERCILGFPECSDENSCSLHKIWAGQREAIKNMLLETTLEDLGTDTKKPA